MGKFKDIDVIDAIKAMKTHIENGRMSLLVGAGASCCACELYQDWYGLIKDMVAFLYADELKAKGVKVEQDKQFYCHYTIEKGGENADHISCLPTIFLPIFHSVAYRNIYR